MATTEREDAEELHRSAGSEENDALQRHIRRAGAIIGKILIDQWHLPPDAVDGFLQDTYQYWDIFCRSVSRPEKWVVRRVVKLAGEYMERRGNAPAADGPDEEAPNIIDVIRDQAALDTLPPKVCKAFVLWVKGHSREHIAKELDVTTAYVRKLINVAVNRLRAWRPRREK